MATAERMFNATIKSFREEDYSQIQALAYSVLGSVGVDGFTREASALLLIALIKLEIDRYDREYWGFDSTSLLASMASDGRGLSSADMLFLQIWSGFFFDPDARGWVYDPSLYQGGFFNEGVSLYRAWRALPSADRAQSAGVVVSSLKALPTEDGAVFCERYERELKNIDAAPRVWDIEG